MSFLFFTNFYISLPPRLKVILRKLAPVKPSTIYFDLFYINLKLNGRLEKIKLKIKNKIKERQARGKYSTRYRLE